MNSTNNLHEQFEHEDVGLQAAILLSLENTERSTEAENQPCSFCSDEEGKQDFIACSEKAHYFCGECFENHVGIEIQKQRFDGRIKCGDSDCAGFISPEELEKLSEINDRILREKRRRILNQHTEEDYPDLDTCPVCHNQAYYGPVAEYPDMYCQYKDCGKDTCRQCRHPSHPERSCEEAAAGHRLSQSPECLIQAALSKSAMIMCPRPDCQVPSVKVDGCEHLSCPKCQQHYCNVCEKPLENGEDAVLEHYATRCHQFSESERQGDYPVLRKKRMLETLLAEIDKLLEEGRNLNERKTYQYGKRCFEIALEGDNLVPYPAGIDSMSGAMGSKRALESYLLRYAEQLAELEVIRQGRERGWVGERHQQAQWEGELAGREAYPGRGARRREHENLERVQRERGQARRVPAHDEMAESAIREREYFAQAQRAGQQARRATSYNEMTEAINREATYFRRAQRELDFRQALWARQQAARGIPHREIRGARREELDDGVQFLEPRLLRVAGQRANADGRHLAAPNHRPFAWVETLVPPLLPARQFERHGRNRPSF